MARKVKRAKLLQSLRGLSRPIRTKSAFKCQFCGDKLKDNGGIRLFCSYICRKAAKHGHKKNGKWPARFRRWMAA